MDEKVLEENDGGESPSEGQRRLVYVKDGGLGIESETCVEKTTIGPGTITLERKWNGYFS